MDDVEGKTPESINTPSGAFTFSTPASPHRHHAWALTERVAPRPACSSTATLLTDANVSVTRHARIRREKLSSTACRYGPGAVEQADESNVDVPPRPTGTRDVVGNVAGQSPGNFTTLRNLTLNGGTDAVSVPPGTYGAFTVNGNASLVRWRASTSQQVAQFKLERAQRMAH